jgi:hypothetical protein
MQPMPPFMSEVLLQLPLLAGRIIAGACRRVEADQRRDDLDELVAAPIDLVDDLLLELGQSHKRDATADVQRPPSAASALTSPVAETQGRA